MNGPRAMRARTRPARSPAATAGTALGLLLTAFILIDLIFRPSFVAVNIDSETSSHAVPLIVSVLHFGINLLIPIPSLYLCMSARGPIDLHRVAPFLGIATGLAIIVMFSLLANPAALSIVYAVLLILTLASAALFMATSDGRRAGFDAFMITTALGSAFALAVAIGLGEYSWGRLASRAGPTYWGMVGILSFATSFSIPRYWLRGIVMAIACATLVLASSRGAMIAIGLAGTVFAGITVARAPSTQRGWYAVAAVIGLALLPLAGSYVAYTLLEIGDPKRGLASGATGRSYAWAQAWQLFVTHPLFGVGYRQHEHYITVATSSHEAYLAVLAELGIGGLVLYLVLVVGAAIRFTREALGARDLGSAAGAAFMWAYLSIGFTENLALGTGLVLPLAMMVVAARGWSTRREPVVVAQPAVPRRSRQSPLQRS